MNKLAFIPIFLFFFQAEDGIRDLTVTGVQTCALPISRFPHIDRAIVRNDLAYSAMLVYLPHGLFGLMIASLAAAYMSTISTHLNCGASYAVEDCYRRFVAPHKDERHYVMVGRAVPVGVIVLASALSLWLQNSYQAFQILLQIGAGTGLIFLLRWFWWRINAWSEIAGMVISFVDRKSTRLNSSHSQISYAVFCLKKKK